MATFSEVIPTQGFLTDKRITEALEQGLLLEKGSWSKDSIRHASYTLRLGDEVRVARAQSSGSTTATKTFELVRLSPGKSVSLRPGDTALLYSLETLRFPDSVLGFTVARGLLFAESLCPENTYVDPGFTGTIYTTVTNVSNRVVELPYGIPVTRLFFYHLSEAVQDGYRKGSSLGISQQLESVHASPVGTAAECQLASDEQLFETIKMIPIGGIHANEALSRIRRRQLEGDQRLWAFALVWPTLLFVINSVPTLKLFLGGDVAVEVLASLVGGALVSYVFPKALAWWSGK